MSRRDGEEDYDKSEIEYERHSRLIAAEADTNWMPNYSALPIANDTQYDNWKTKEDSYAYIY